MRMPWTGLIERSAAEAVEAARPQIERVAKERAISDLSRAMTSMQSLNPLPTAGYPGVHASPYPLYGMDRPIWYATPNSPKRRPDSLVDIDTIRRFADTYDVMRSCINHLKREVRAQAFSVVSKDKSQAEAKKGRIAEASRFFDRNGGLGEANETRRHYEQKIFEDTLVVGAFASWKNRSRSGKLLQVLAIDSSTIRPRIDAYGWPGPDEDWYEQWIMGMKVTGFRKEELIYDGLWPVTHSPWFRSPVEYLIATVLTALKADEWNRSWLTDGNTPGQTISTPPEWTPTQIKEYHEIFNMMLAGDVRERNKTVLIPGGAKPSDSNSRKDQDFQEFMLWLLRRTCSMFGVQPSSIGYAGEQYKVSQEGSNDQTTQFGAGDLLDLRKEHYDDLLADLGYEDLEVFNGEAAEEDPLKRAQRLTLMMGGKPWGAENDARQQDGLAPIEGGDLIPQSVQPAVADAEESETEEEADLNRWMRKSLRRAKDGKPAQCEFQSEHIDSIRHSQILNDLARCQTLDDIRTVFA